MKFTSHSMLYNVPTIVVITLPMVNNSLIGDSFLCVSLLGLTVSPPSTLYIYYTLLIYINQLFLTKKPDFSDFFSLIIHFLALLNVYLSSPAVPASLLALPCYE